MNLQYDTNIRKFPKRAIGDNARDSITRPAKLQLRANTTRVRQSTIPSNGGRRASGIRH